MNKIIIIAVVVAVITGVGSFYGGMKYAQGQRGGGNFQNLANLSPEERQQRFQGMGANASGLRGGRAGGGLTSGEVISKDEKSVTVKLRDGGSKIIFFFDSTEVGKFTSGTVTDLEIGKMITINGKTNSDGSVTADSIQIRPPMQQPLQ